MNYNRFRVRNQIRAVVAATVLSTAVSGQVALAQNTASLPPTVRVEGPTVVHDQSFSDARIEVSSIDVPFSPLTLMILNVRGWPYSTRNRVFGAHAHTKPCAVDPVASGPHYADPASDATKAIAAREVWLDINIDSQGRGTSFALFDWRIRKGDAGSVVIHAEPTNRTTGAAGARILCTAIALGS